MILNKYLPGFIVEPLVRLLKKPKLEFMFNGFIFSYYDDYICFRAGLVENYEPEVFRVIDGLNKRLNVFYDIGANQGIFSVPLSIKFNQVFSFECSPTVLSRLYKNIKINSINNIKVVEKCVSDKPGIIDFYVSESENSGTSSKLKDVNIESNSRNAIQVDSITLDSFVFDFKNPPPDMIKIDVEGSEKDVIVGASRLINYWKPVVIFECNNEYDLTKIIKQFPRGYKVYPIYQIGFIGFVKKVLKVYQHNYVAVDTSDECQDL